MARALTDKALEDLRDCIRRDVAAGFLDEDGIAESAVAYLGDEFDPDALALHADRLTHEALAAHLREQAMWPATTDCDRLDAAFSALERERIVCRQNFSCCGTCGAVEIRDEMEQVASDGTEVRGYAFYHVQDTESAVEGTGLYLNYGATEEGEATALQIAREICAALMEQGLTVHWDGTWATRIAVSLDWKKRR